MNVCFAHVYVPSAFHSNDDGINITLLPLALGIQPINFKIYDHWVAKLFESIDAHISWNGKSDDKIAH